MLFISKTSRPLNPAFTVGAVTCTEETDARQGTLPLNAGGKVVGQSDEFQRLPDDQPALRHLVGAIAAEEVKISAGLQERHNVPAMEREVKHLTLG